MEKREETKIEIRNTLNKEERLCSKKVIDKLFNEGTAFLVFPLRVVFLHTDLASQYPVQAGFSVSKKSFKRAVKRNLLKRRMRESYRLNKQILYTNSNRKLAVFFIYVGKEIIEYKRIENAMKKALLKLQSLAEIKQNEDERG